MGIDITLLDDQHGPLKTGEETTVWGMIENTGTERVRGTLEPLGGESYEATIPCPDIDLAPPRWSSSTTWPP